MQTSSNISHLSRRIKFDIDFFDIVNVPLDMKSSVHLSCGIDISYVFIFYFFNYGLTAVLV